jgi:iron complex outermembrane recepter protein
VTTLRTVRTLGYAALVAILGISAGNTALGQTASGGSADSQAGLQEIVVTAQKRAENLEETPIAVTALTGQDMQQRQVLSVETLAESVPNFDFGVYSGNAHLAIRGLGFDSINPGAEARVAYHEDGVYLARPADILGTFFDVNRVEVLRGPQGTLYGRNSTGGSVNVITNDPTPTFGGYYRQTIGNYSTFIEEGAVGGPLTNDVEGRLAVQVVDHSGYGENLETGHEIDNAKTWSVRGKLKFLIADNFNLLLTADYHREDDSNYGFHYIGPGNPLVIPPGVTLHVPIAQDSYDIAQASDPINKREIWGLSAVADWKLNDSMSLRSISAYRYSDYQAFSDATGMGDSLLPFNQVEKSDSASEELQLTQDTQRYHWIAGLYYFHEHVNSFSQAPVNAGLFGGSLDTLLEGYYAGGTLSTEASAIFGQGTYDITDTFSATLGLRFGNEHKSINDGLQFDAARIYSPTNPLNLIATQQDSITENSFTPKVIFEYHPVNDLMSYLSVSKGYKSGGFDNGAVAPPYGPENVIAYELGIKGQWFDHRLQANADVFYYDARDLQVSVIVNTAVMTENAARAHVKGAEFELDALPAKGWKADLAVGYLDSKYAEFMTSDPQRPELGVLNLSGNTLPQAPEWTVEAGLQYTANLGSSGTLTTRAEDYYVSTTYFTPFDVSVNERPSNSRVNGFITWASPDERWTAQLYGKNLGNKKVLAYDTPTSAFSGYPVVGYFQPPRTFGVTVGYNF